MKNRLTTFFPGTLCLVIVLGAIGWLTTKHRPVVVNNRVMQTTAAAMPNLSGDAAQGYLKEQGLHQSLSEAIRAARYSVNWVKQAPIPSQSGAFQAHNPEQNYSAFFANDEVHLVSREADETWRVAMKLTGYGYGSEQWAVSSGQWAVTKTRIERVWTLESGVTSSNTGLDSRLATPDSRLVEWYENKPEGLEQGFTINAPPDSRLQTPDSRLHLVLQLEGDLKARLEDDGQALSFSEGEHGATVLRYGKLKSTDAKGKELASRMELRGDELSLVVDDSDAVYPLTIDPLFTQIKKLTASDVLQSGGFGIAVAISGDTLVIGARFGLSTGQGSAHIFERNQGGADNWVEVKKLIAPDGEPNDLFGWSVAISGDTVIVSANQDTVGENMRQGSAYVYDRNAGGPNNWGLVKQLTASDGVENDSFGGVSTNGDTAIVVAVNNVVPTGRSGAYIFQRDQGGANNWGEVKIIRQTQGNNQDDGIGGGVAMSGDTAIISAPKYHDLASNNHGAAFILERDEGGANNWGIVKKIIHTNQSFLSDGYGSSVAISNGKAIVGSGNGGLFGGGTLRPTYVYERNAGGANNWGEVKQLVGLDSGNDDSFGWRVAISNDTAIIGAPFDDVGTNTDQGSAYIFKQNTGGANNWGQVKKVTASDGAVHDFFGWSIALEDKTLLVGAMNDDGANLSQGSAYVFKTENDSWVEDAKPLPANCTVDDGFGYSVALSGDTAVVGTFAADVGTNANQGAAYIFERNQGGPNNWGLVKTLTASDGVADDRFGLHLAISNDTIIAGALNAKVGGNSKQGAVYIFERNAGGANNWGEVRKLTAADGTANNFFGFGVAISNDTAIVSANSTSHGAAYVYERNASGANNWGQIKKLLASDGASGDRFAVSVGISGDTIVVGADLDDVGANVDQGSAYIFERNAGGTNNWGEVKKLLAIDGSAKDQLGLKAAISGDTVVVSATAATVGGNIVQGCVYVFNRHTGGANNWGAVKKLLASDGGAVDYFGISVGVSGDTIVVGPLFKTVGTNSSQGSAYIFKQNAGGVNNWGEVKKLVASDGAAYDYFGAKVAISGENVIVGAHFDDQLGVVDLGSAYIFASQNDTWPEQKQLLPPLPTDCGSGDGYGFSVAISGDTVLIGAWGDDVGANRDQGSVYILERNQGGANHWGLVKLLTASDGAGHGTYGDGFGYSVAISGDTVVIGSFQATIAGNDIQGAAYVFERNAGGPNNWEQVKKLTASDGAAFDRFGGSVSIDNNTVIVGADGADVNGNSSQGAAYIFERNLGGTENWGEARKLVASDGRVFDGFASVSISADTAVVGAHGHDVGANADQGSAYIFERNSGGVNRWGEVKRLTASDGAADDRFGTRVSISGNTMIVGSYLNDIGDNVDQGAAYIFERNFVGANNWGEVRRLVMADGAAGDYFGFSARISGDTAIVGAFLDDVGDNVDQGSAYIFEQNKGGANNWGQVQRLLASDGSSNDGFGYAVDVSGDNFIIGAYFAEVSSQSASRNTKSSPSVPTDQAYVFRGVASDSAPTAAPALISGQITTADGTPLAGVTMRLSGSKSAHTITDGNGEYRFENVDTDGFYTVTPSLVNYSFTPGNRSFSLLADKTDAVFTAVPDTVVVANPIDTADYFVRQHYLDFLNREPDDSGFNFWSDQIASCGSDAGCLEVKRINVSAAYFLSIEFQQTGGLVDSLYRTSYGRRPLYAEFMPDTAGVAQNVIVGASNWQQQLAANKQAFLEAFVQRAVFREAYDHLNNSQYVAALIAHTGINFAPSEGDELVNGLANGTLTRAAVLLRVAEDPRFVSVKRNEVFVMMEYFGYLRRDPDESGYQFWLNKLNQFGGDFQRAEMVKAFIISSEYRTRFRR